MERSFPGPGDLVNDRTILGLSTAWRCISLLSETIASLAIMTYKRDSDGVARPFPEHALYRILNDDPNYDQTTFDFWHFITCSIEMRGNSYPVLPGAKPRKLSDTNQSRVYQRYGA
ncbi:MAG: Phage-related protein [Candidatus Tokpelaia sp. JSC189]|nr:MAG: Phage-related protein [Candidatus Tokpelaia sp. JSC189]